MDKFDDLLFEMVGKDKSNIPKEINNKIDETLKNLDIPRPRKKKKLLKFLILVAVITVLSATTIIANSEYNFYSGTLDGLLQSDKELKEKIEELQVKVEESDTSKGITYKVDSVSVDENYIYVLYNIESSKNLKEIQDENIKNDKVFSRRLSSYQNVYINGKISELDRDDNGYFVNDNLYVGFMRISLIDRKIENKFKLKIVVGEIGNLEGRWVINTNVEKKDTKDKSKIIDINTEHNIEIFEGRNCDFIINRIIMSPLGNQILITNKGWGIDTNFKLFDDKGNELEVIYDSVSGNENGETKNKFDFVLENKDSKYINFVPYRSVEVKEHSVFEQVYDISSLPKTIKLSPNSEITLLEMTQENGVLVIKYEMKGTSVTPSLNFLDNDGEDVDKSIIEEVDKITGIHTETYFIKDNKKVDLSKIKLFYKEIDDELLLRDKVITIPIK